MTNYAIFRLLGLGLLILGGLSGIFLFLRAITGFEKASSKEATATLWGLFIIGVVAGIIIIAIT